MWLRRGRALLMLCTSVLVATPLLAMSAGTANGSSASTHSKILEVDVMNEAVRGGEPELAINPKNPQDIVMGHTVVGNTYTKNTTADTMAAVAGGLQVSFNGGKTWSADDKPLHTAGYSEGPNPYSIAHGFPGATGFTLTTNGIGDPIEATGPDGSIYAGGVFVHTTSPGPPPFNFTVPQGGIAIFRSTNGGRSFGPLSAVMTDQDLGGMVSRGMNPKPIGVFGVNPYDRPWMVVDQTTGAVYVSTTGHPERYVAVSHDKARTWGRVEALDCDETPAPNPNHNVTCNTYPEIGDGNIAAAHGVLAAAYIAGAAPGSTCPCAVFETSTDEGAHWNRHVVFDALSSSSGVWVAADPAHKGRYAVMVLPGYLAPSGLPGLPPSKSVPQEVDVTTTADSGGTWTQPTVLGNQSTTHITNKPWIAYGPTGVLAALWRNALPSLQPGIVPDAWLPERVCRNFPQQWADLQRSIEAQLRAVTSARSETGSRG